MSDFVPLQEWHPLYHRQSCLVILQCCGPDIILNLIDWAEENILPTTFTRFLFDDNVSPLIPLVNWLFTVYSDHPIFLSFVFPSYPVSDTNSAKSAFRRCYRNYPNTQDCKLIFQLFFMHHKMSRPALLLCRRGMYELLQ